MTTNARPVNASPVSRTPRVSVRPRTRWAQSDLGTLHTNNGSVHQVVDQFIKSGPTAPPQFITDEKGQAHLLIHGSPPQNGEVSFYIGEGQQFGDNPPGYVRQGDLDDWMVSQGYAPQTPVIGCYSGAASGVNSEFGNTGEIEVSAPTDGSGEDLNFASAANAAVRNLRLAKEADREGNTRLADRLHSRVLAALAYLEKPIVVAKKEPEESAGKRERGNLDFHGLPLYIEYPKGSTREKKGADGKTWKRKMAADYGRIGGTKGADGDCIDVFVGPDDASKTFFILDQVRADGTFDEHKVICGVSSKKEARDLYLANYPTGWKCGKFAEMTLPEFRKWLKSGDKKKPAA